LCRCCSKYGLVSPASRLLCVAAWVILQLFGSYGATQQAGAGGQSAGAGRDSDCVDKG
jgi:hypothetical protein